MKSDSKSSNQTANQFANEKKQTLLKVDKSIAASIDEPIRDIVHLINGLNNYFTTSSCSGRVIITGTRKSYYEGEDNDNNNDNNDNDNDNKEVKYNLKKNLKWLYNSHVIIEDDGDEIILQVDDNANNYKTLTFKFEPAILHVRSNSAQDLLYARKLLNIAIASGYRNSGMVLSQSKHCTVAIRSTASLEVPLVDDGERLVSSDYLRHLVRIANRKMKSNFELLKRLHSNLKEL